MKRKAYRSVAVNQVDPRRLVAARGGQAVHVGLDVGKQSIVCVLRWQDRDFCRPWKVSNPDEIAVLVRLLEVVGEGRAMTIALEPTGTYGDALRQALHDAELRVWRVSGKAAKDYAEIFDGVPSQHDGKDAAVVAELAAQGRCNAWDFVEPAAEDAAISYLVEAIDWERRQMMPWVGRLEGLLSRHWPEVTRLLKATSGTLLRVLERYGSPGQLAADPGALAQLRSWGRSRLTAAKAERILASAQATSGVRVATWDERRLRDIAGTIRTSQGKIAQLKRSLEKVCQSNEVIQRQASAVGVVTACVLWKHLGHPERYHCGAAYRKAMGLNLTERSSGQWQGALRVSKRGSAEVRRWLYLAALRLVRRAPGIGAWYQEQKRQRQGACKPALVGVMRKLALALYQVGAQGQTFASEQVFASLSLGGGVAQQACDRGMK